MNEFNQKLWEINLKLEELKNAFVELDQSEEKDHEYAQCLGDMEKGYGKMITLIAKDRGMPLPFAFTNEDIKWILGIPGAKKPDDF